MGLKATAWRALQLFLLVAVLALVVGQVLGQPLLLSFVTTGSMEPTLEPGDGFVAIPPELAGDIGEGDVVTFDAEEIEGGGLTTHRIVEETDEGYVTQGDANPFTDQDGGEPIVQDPEIATVAWQPGSDVLVIPYLGTIAMAIQSGFEWLQLQLASFFSTDVFLGTEGLAYLLFAGSIMLYFLLGYVEPSRQRDREDNPSRAVGANPRMIVLALTLVLVVGATSAMVVPSETEEFGIVSAEFESDSPDVIEQGTSESYDYPLVNPGVFSTVAILEPQDERMTVNSSVNTLSSRDSTNATVTLSAPDETGSYTTHLEQRRYLGILPTSTIVHLHDVHPWLPIVVINAVIAVPFYLFGMRLVGTGRIRSRQRAQSNGLF